MPFRFANVSGRAALVDADDQWYAPSLIRSRS